MQSEIPAGQAGSSPREQGQVGVRNQALVFGASGHLGSAIADYLQSQQIDVVRASRSTHPAKGWIATDNAAWPSELEGRCFDRVIWAQGANASGSVDSQLSADLTRLFDANVTYIASTLERLSEHQLIARGSRLCVVSSIWQDIARTGKIAYITSKAAVGGLMRALATDLGASGIAINAVLPGVVDSEMTRAFLTPAQVESIQDQTPFGSLPTDLDIARVCSWLTSADSNGITGQSLVVDQGWSLSKHV